MVRAEFEVFYHQDEVPNNYGYFAHRNPKYAGPGASLANP